MIVDPRRTSSRVCRSKYQAHHRYRFRQDKLLNLSRFDTAPLTAFTATKEIEYGAETKGRIPPRYGAYFTDQRADTEVSSDDLGIGMTALDKWVKVSMRGLWLLHMLRHL